MKTYDPSQDHDDRPSRNPAPGYIYLVECVGKYKIGKAIDPTKRLYVMQTASPEPMTLIHSVYVSDMDRAERWLHYMHAKVHIRGEWFALSPEDVEWLKRVTTQGFERLWAATWQERR